MTEAGWVDIAVAVLALLGVVSTALSGVMVARFNAIRRDVATVKHEVKNDHSKNLRLEQDERHDENVTKLDQILDLVGWLAQGWIDNRNDIHDLQEQTGQGNTRRARRLAAQRPPIHSSEIPKG